MFQTGVGYRKINGLLNKASGRFPGCLSAGQQRETLSAAARRHLKMAKNSGDYQFESVFEGERGFSAEEYDLQMFMGEADLPKKCNNFEIHAVPLYMELAIYIYIYQILNF